MKLRRDYKIGDKVSYINPYTNERKCGEILQVWNSPSIMYPQGTDYHAYFDDNEEVYTVSCPELIDGIKTCCWVQYKHILHYET